MCMFIMLLFFVFLNVPAATEIYTYCPTLSLHDALPISSIGGKDISASPLMRGFLSQGCLPGSLYDDDAYGVPNGFALPYVAAAATQINLTVEIGRAHV